MSGVFAHELQPESTYIYDGEKGPFLIKMQAKYEEASGLTLAAGAALTSTPRWPESQRYLRHQYISTKDSLGNLHRRRVPISHAMVVTPTAIGTPIDGLLDWKRGSAIGERTK